MPDNKVDGIKKLSKEEIKRSRDIVLDIIGESSHKQAEKEGDYLINSKNIDFMRNVGTQEQPYMFRNMGQVDPHQLAGHTTCPAIVDWDHNGIPNLLIGAEDGFMYYLSNV